MAKKVFALDTKPGIQRDGTVFDREYYVDGVWTRFQRGRPRKIGGFKQIVQGLAGPSRGIYVLPRNSFNNVYSGYNNGLQYIPIDNNGVGSGIVEYTFSGGITTLGTITPGSSYTDGTYTGVTLTGGSGSGATATVVVSGNVVTSVTITGAGIQYQAGDTLSAAAASIGGTGSGFSIPVTAIDSPFTPSDDNLWQFDTFKDASGSGQNLLLAHASQDLSQIDSETNTPVMAGPVSGSTLYAIGVFTEVATTITSGSSTVTLANLNTNIGAGQVVTGAGIPAGTTVVSVTTTT